MAPRTLCWLLLFVLVGALALRTHAILQPADSDTLYREHATYQYLRDIIKERYVEEVDKELEEKIFFGAMEGMTSSLDPHSRFFPPKEYEQFEIQTMGQLEGIGVELDPMDARGITVLTPILNTPAWRGGILPGDVILKIDGQSTDKMTAEQARSLIKGPEGSSVTLTIQHEGESSPVEITLQRAVVDVPSVPVAEMLGTEWIADGAQKIGYVQVTGFQQKTSEDIEEALNKLEAEGMQALILDLRQNHGGLLRSAEEICDFFLKDGPIVSVIGRRGEDGRAVEQTTYAKDTGTHPNYPVVVLIDGESASASEIVSGCLKDRGRAVLVGDKSYGKFSVQEVIPVPLVKFGRAALKLTTAKYKTPVGECEDGKGIVPDYLVPSTPEQQRALKLDRFQRHLKDNNPRSERPVKNVHEVYGQKNDKGEKKPVEPFVDQQLKKAVEVAILRLKTPVPAPSDNPTAAQLETKKSDK